MEKAGALKISRSFPSWCAQNDADCGSRNADRNSRFGCSPLARGAIVYRSSLALAGWVALNECYRTLCRWDTRPQNAPPIFESRHIYPANRIPHSAFRNPRLPKHVRLQHNQNSDQRCQRNTMKEHKAENIAFVTVPTRCS